MANVATTCHWNGKMNFTAKCGEHTVLMDAKSPMGSDLGPTPKQLVLAGICGCSGMDVAALMRKYKQEVATLDIDADTPLSEGHPSVFTEVNVVFRFTGGVDPEKAKEAVTLSMTKYCGVSAMIVKNNPIRYKILVNGTEIHQGEAKF